MLSIQNVSYRYGDDAPVLRHVSLEIARGERVALLGPSGYGKSTLALLLAGYLPMQEGAVTLAGKPIPQDGYCPVQLVYQHPEKAMDPRWKLKKTLSEAWDIPAELFTAIGAQEDWLRRFPHELSGVSSNVSRSCARSVLRLVSSSPMRSRRVSIPLRRRRFGR